MGYSLAPETEDVPILYAGRDGEHHGAAQRRHLSLTAEDKCVESHRHRHVQVIVPAFKLRIGQHLDAQVQVARLSTGRARPTFARHTDAGAGVGSGRDLHLQPATVLLKDARGALVGLPQADLDLLFIVLSALGADLILEASRRGSTAHPTEDLAEEIGERVAPTEQVSQVLRRAVADVDALPLSSRGAGGPVVPVKVAGPPACCQ